MATGSLARLPKYGMLPFSLHNGHGTSVVRENNAPRRFPVPGTEEGLIQNAIAPQLALVPCSPEVVEVVVNCHKPGRVSKHRKCPTDKQGGASCCAASCTSAFHNNTSWARALRIVHVCLPCCTSRAVRVGFFLLEQNSQMISHFTCQTSSTNIQPHCLHRFLPSSQPGIRLSGPSSVGRHGA